MVKRVSTWVLILFSFWLSLLWMFCNVVTGLKCPFMNFFSLTPNFLTVGIWEGALEPPYHPDPPLSIALWLHQILWKKCFSHFGKEKGGSWLLLWPLEIGLQFHPEVTWDFLLAFESTSLHNFINQRDLPDLVFRKEWRGQEKLQRLVGEALLDYTKLEWSKTLGEAWFFSLIWIWSS